jgi:ribonuclease VapC
MVIDTSAVLAWLKEEPERERIAKALKVAPLCRISAVTVLELHIVVRGRESPSTLEKLERFLKGSTIVVIPFDACQAELADTAFLRYGKGQGHKAQLNFGDCAVYALAKFLNEPLLFVGNDFAQTDILKY